MAGDLACAVLLLSQLNRGVEGRENKEPLLSDLRESGSIEQDADLAMFLYRPGMYTNGQDDREAYLLVRKNRYGRTGDIPLCWIGEYFRYEDSECFTDVPDSVPKEWTDQKAGNK